MLTETISAQKVQANVPVDIGADDNPEVVRPGQSSPETEQGGPDARLLQEVLDVAQAHFQVRDIGLEIVVHEQTGRIKVTVRDKDTGETVREVPPQQILDLMAKIDEMMGVLFDQKA